MLAYDSTVPAYAIFPIIMVAYLAAFSTLLVDIGGVTAIVCTIKTVSAYPVMST